MGDHVNLARKFNFSRSGAVSRTNFPFFGLCIDNSESSATKRRAEGLRGLWKKRWFHSHRLSFSFLLYLVSPGAR
jgi:hypothetical protein